jgi:hypothetical protein
MDEDRIVEVEPNKFVRMINSKVVGPATSGDFICYQIRQEIADVDAGIIEVSLALTAAAGFFTSVSPLLLSLIGAVAFALGILASTALFLTYVFSRVPKLWTRFFSSERYRQHKNRFGKREKGNSTRDGRRWRYSSREWSLFGAFLLSLWYYPRQVYLLFVDPEKVSIGDLVPELGYLILMAAFFLLEGLASVYVSYMLYNNSPFA